MIYGFILYPHEVCYEPIEHLFKYNRVCEHISSYSDHFSFSDMISPVSGRRIKKDEFDLLCTPEHPDLVQLAYENLKRRLDAFSRSDYGIPFTYAFNLHNLDLLEDGSPEKPHFHVYLFFPTLEFGDDPSFLTLKNVLLIKLGAFKYDREDIEAYNRVFERYVVVALSEKWRVTSFLSCFRQERLRYLCHLDEDPLDPHKHFYPTSCVCANFDYVNDVDVLNVVNSNPYKTFLKIVGQYDINSYRKWFHWLAYGNYDPNVADQLKSIKADIKEYFRSYSSYRK